MPLSGEYAPGTSKWARKQAEAYEASDGTKAADLRGRPIIVLTSVGAKTGKLRKTALMRASLDPLSGRKRRESPDNKPSPNHREG